MVVTGSNVSFGPDGTFLGIMDAGMTKAWVDQGIKGQGCGQMTCITAPVPKYAR
jgi:2,4'-dihydroxyacetophenone dioxygenase